MNENETNWDTKEAYLVLTNNERYFIDRVFGQLDDRRRPVENLSAPIENEVVVSRHECKRDQKLGGKPFLIRKDVVEML